MFCKSCIFYSFFTAANPGGKMHSTLSQSSHFGQNHLLPVCVYLSNRDINTIPAYFHGCDNQSLAGSWSFSVAFPGTDVIVLHDALLGPPSHSIWFSFNPPPLFFLLECKLLYDATQFLFNKVSTGVCKPWWGPGWDLDTWLPWRTLQRHVTHATHGY